MQPTPLPTPNPPPPAPAFTALRLPMDLRLGIVLAVLGWAFAVGSNLWSRFGLQTVPGSGFVGYLQISFALGFAAELSTGLGFFLILRGVLRLVPRLGPWARLGPLLILTGTIISGVAYALFIILFPSIYPIYSGSTLTFLYDAANLLALAGSIISPLGIVIGLVAVALGALAQRRSALPPLGF